MKVDLLVENIEKYLSLISKALPTHSQVPILSNILIDANKNGLFLKATDLELGVEIKIPAKIEEEGCITVPGKQFIEVISSLPKDKLILTLDKDILKLTCRGNKVSFQTISQDEFPDLYKNKGEEVGRFSKAEFLDIFSYLVFCVSTEDSRPQLTGVYISKRNGLIDFVATDGYRMSIKTLESSKELTEGLIISVRLINEVMSLKNDFDEIIIHVNTAGSQVVFSCGDVTIVGRMIEGAFPDYKKAIPATSSTTLVIGREEFLQNVRLASVFAREDSNILQLEVEGQNMKLLTKSAGVGEGFSEFDVEKKGDDVRIAFNAKYLLDVLKTIQEKNITLKLNSSAEAALFEVGEKKFSHIIMPVQTKD